MSNMKIKNTYNMTEYIMLMDKCGVGITYGISHYKFDLKLNKWTQYESSIIVTLNKKR